MLDTHRSEPRKIETFTSIWPVMSHRFSHDEASRTIIYHLLAMYYPSIILPLSTMVINHHSPVFSWSTYHDQPLLYHFQASYTITIHDNCPFHHINHHLRWWFTCFLATKPLRINSTMLIHHDPVPRPVNRVVAPRCTMLRPQSGRKKS